MVRVLADNDIRLEGDSSAGNGSPGHVLDLIRRAGGMSRADIIAKTGLSRSTVAARLDTLQAAGWISAGRPPPRAVVRPAISTSAPRRAHCWSPTPGPPVSAPRSPTCAARSGTSCGYHSTSPWDPNSGSQRSGACSRNSRKRWDRSRFRTRHRDRGARPRGLRQCDGGQPADHDRLGRIPDPVVVRGPLRMPGVGRQRRQRHDAG